MQPHYSLRDFQEINYPKKRTTEAQSTQRENFCISFGTFFYLEVSNVLRPVEDIKDNAIIVLDTNTLLVPYTTGTNSLNQIQKIYKELIQKIV